VNPDEFYVFKPTLTGDFRPILQKKLGTKEFRRFVLSDDDVLTLARWAVLVEQHYSKLRHTPTPMDTVSCAEGDEGFVYRGRLPIRVERTNLADLPRPRTHMMMTWRTRRRHSRYRSTPIRSSKRWLRSSTQKSEQRQSDHALWRRQVDETTTEESVRQSGRAIIHCAVQGRQLRVVLLRNVDTKPLVQTDYEVEEVHRIEIEFLPQNGVRLQLLWIDLRRNAGERLNDGMPNLVACHSLSGA
jgi:hypothetical protein